MSSVDGMSDADVWDGEGSDSSASGGDLSDGNGAEGA